ncbi:MAG TPA: DUF2817 domain-containing protein [bacterium]|nr:DUF2817 domain-containing protein [bacterium]HQO33876.1 DUF2817 domain-containing protein [bacterium]HQP98115.1 DUF2817 domain-containing protein [bacterium]
MRRRPRLWWNELEKSIAETVSRYASDLRTEDLGFSVEGRAIRAVHVLPLQEESLCEGVLIISGHHGMEDGGPRTALRLLEWLAGEEGRVIRQHLAVSVIPCVNPDGYDQDRPFNSANVNLDKDYASLSQPESRAVWALAERLAPELAVDVHTFGGGCSSELLVSYPHGLTHYGRWIHFLIADRVNRAAEQAGFPQWPTLRLDPKAQNDLIPPDSGPATFPDRCHQQFGSLAFYVEMNDTSYSPEESTESGLARLKELLRIGTERFWGEGDPGYPVRIVSSLPPNAIAVSGDTAAERRACRLDLWPVRSQLFADPLWPERPGRYQVTFRHAVSYWKPSHGVAMRARFSKRFSPGRILINGDLLPKEAVGLRQWTGDGAHTVQIERPDQWYGGFTMAVEYGR